MKLLLTPGSIPPGDFDINIGMISLVHLSWNFNKSYSKENIVCGFASGQNWTQLRNAWVCKSQFP